MLDAMEKASVLMVNLFLFISFEMVFFIYNATI